MIDFCVWTSDVLCCKDTKSRWPIYTTFYTTCFWGVPHFITWLITFHKQIQAHCLQAELLAFVFSPPAPLLHITGALICHPSNSPLFILQKCSISSFPTSLSCIGGVCSFTKTSSFMYASIPTVLLKPLPFDFYPLHLFSSLLLCWVVHKTRICLLMAAFPSLPHPGHLEISCSPNP